MDYSVLAFWFAAGILVYLVLLKLLPGAARVWFCLGEGRWWASISLSISGCF